MGMKFQRVINAKTVRIRDPQKHTKTLDEFPETIFNHC